MLISDLELHFKSFDYNKLSTSANYNSTKIFCTMKVYWGLSPLTKRSPLPGSSWPRSCLWASRSLF